MHGLEGHPLVNYLLDNIDGKYYILSIDQVVDTFGRILFIVENRNCLLFIDMRKLVYKGSGECHVQNYENCGVSNGVE